MSKLKVIHLAPSDRFKTGIASYADIVDQIFKDHLANEIEVQRVEPRLYLKALECEANPVVLAQIGTNEGGVFRVLRKQVRKFPTVRRIIEIHDPPRFVLSYTELLEYISTTLLGRAIRRLFDRLFGDWYMRSMIGSMDIFVCKTEIGARALREQFTRLKVCAPVVCIELANYLDAPPSKRTHSATEPIIGFFGYISPDKGVHILVDAAIRLQAMHGIAAVPRISIRGSLASQRWTKYLEDMKRRVCEAGLSEKIDFGGFIPFEELPGFVASLSAVALPYIKDNRLSASGPLLWARTCRVPVLAHRTTVFESYVLDGIDGFLIPIGELYDWAEIMTRVAMDPDWAQKLYPGLDTCQSQGSWMSTAQRFRKLLGLPQESIS